MVFSRAADLAEPGIAVEPPEQPRCSGAVPEPSSVTLEEPGCGATAKPYMSIPTAPMPATGASNLTAPRPTCDRIIAMAHESPSSSAWLPAQGLLLYAVANAIIIEDLSNRRQKYLVHNRQAITTLAVVGGGSAIVASASRCVNRIHKICNRPIGTCMPGPLTPQDRLCDALPEWMYLCDDIDILSHVL